MRIVQFGIAAALLFSISAIGVATPSITGQPWEVVVVEGATIAIPAGWRNFDGLKASHLIYRSGDGIGVPLVDETQSPLQIGLTVERFDQVDSPLEKVIAGLVEDAKSAPNLVLVGNEVVELTLSDSTRALLLTTEFLKGQDRRSLQMKLAIKDSESNVWIISGYLVGGRESTLPKPGSDLVVWLRTHLASFTLEGGRFDGAAVAKLYGSP